VDVLITIYAMSVVFICLMYWWCSFICRLFRDLVLCQLFLPWMHCTPCTDFAFALLKYVRNEDKIPPQIRILYYVVAQKKWCTWLL